MLKAVSYIKTFLLHLLIKLKTLFFRSIKSKYKSKVYVNLILNRLCLIIIVMTVCQSTEVHAKSKNEQICLFLLRQSKTKPKEAKRTQPLLFYQNISSQIFQSGTSQKLR